MEKLMLIFVAAGIIFGVISCVLFCVCCRKRRKRYDEESLLGCLDQGSINETDFRMKIEDFRSRAENAPQDEAKRIYQLTAEAMVRYNSIKNPRPDVDADFHCLTVPEVKQYLPFALNDRFDVQRKLTFIIDTGKGNHSENGRGVLKHVVPKILSDNGYKSIPGPDDGKFIIYRPENRRRCASVHRI